jgi:DMSO/TMAO reductase YedYZ molybdopterin-dependent catalytic subunit
MPVPDRKPSQQVIESPDTKREQRVPPGQHLVKDWPVLHAGQVPRFDPAAWTLKISGLVERERRLSFQEFMALPMVNVRSDIHCVTTWSLLDNDWEGVSSSTIRTVCPPLPTAGFVIVHAAGGWTTNLALEDFFQPDVLFAVRHNGQPIAPEHGAPVRLVVPRLYFWKSAKWVTAIEYVEKDEPGFWESRGYHNRGDPWKEERYSD